MTSFTPRIFFFFVFFLLGLFPLNFLIPHGMKKKKDQRALYLFNFFVGNSGVLLVPRHAPDIVGTPKTLPPSFFLNL